MKIITTQSKQESYVITGGSGFIGSHLTDLLLRHGKRVIVIDNFSTGSRQNLVNVFGHPNFLLAEGDAGSKELLERYVPENATIVHLAATVGVEKVCENSLLTANNNLNSMIGCLEIAKAKNCKVFFSSTSEVYGSNDPSNYSEDSTLSVCVHHGGRSAYTLSKLYAELQCLAYHETFDIPVIVGRFFNTIGPRQYGKYGMVVPKFINQAIRGKAITVYGCGNQIRSFCDVRDTVRAIYQLLQFDGAYGQIYNIGNTAEITITQLATYVKEITQSDSPIVYVPMPPERDKGKDIFFRKPIVEKLKRDTDWNASFSWKEAIQHIIAIQHSQQNANYEFSSKRNVS